MLHKTSHKMLRRLPVVAAALSCLLPSLSFADGNLQKVNHIIIVMQENHSFDNYFGALAYAPGGPYHTRFGGCRKEDHNCVDGLSCRVDAAGTLTCFNSNLDDNGSTVFAFHDSRRCALPDLDHSWLSTHRQANFVNPNATLTDTLNESTRIPLEARPLQQSPSIRSSKFRVR